MSVQQGQSLQDGVDEILAQQKWQSMYCYSRLVTFELTDRYRRPTTDIHRLQETNGQSRFGVG